MMQHLIHRQELRLAAPSRAEAVQAQEAYRQAFWRLVLPRLEAVFSEVSSPHQVHRLDYLEIDLGSLPLQGFEQALAQRVEQEARQQLTKLMPERNWQREADEAAISSLTTEQAEEDALLHFLEQGVLPWWGQPMERATWEQSLTRLARQRPQCLRQRATPDLRNRLLLQLSPSTLEQLLEILGAAQATSWRAPILLLQHLAAHATKFSASSPLGASLVQAYHAWALESLLRTPLPPYPAFQALATNWWALLRPAQAWEAMQTTLEQHPAPASTLPLLSVLLQAPAEEPVRSATPPEAALPQRETSREQEALSGTNGQPPEHMPGKALRDASPGRQEEASSQRVLQQLPTEAAAGLMIERAGLVLVAPFLGSFFRKLELVEGRAFASEAKARRAVLLSHYLASGQTEVDEFHLPLCKLLCGWPLQQPLDRVLDLSAREEAEAADLLQAAIDHWGVLGNTSVDNFRQTFLQRIGKLQLQDAQAHLCIERRGVDVLLEKLPWSIHFIKLAWMEHPLTVEW